MMEEGYAALRRGAAWLDLASRGRILARGRDRARLLHNVTTNEVGKMAPGDGCYAFLLSPQGRIQADLLLFCFEDRFLIETEPELREKAVQHIRRYIVADQVELEDIGLQTGEIGLEGPGAAAVLAALGAPAPEAEYSHLAWNGSTIARASLTGQPGFRIFCPAAAAGDLIGKLQSAGARPATAQDARVVRIENGKPRYGEDIRDTTLPQETRQMHAVSFTKGCYIGQEIVERIRARGHVNRKIERIELEGADSPPPGTVMEIGGRQAEITSSAYSADLGKMVALAYVRE
jgi:aminomethyltransferase